MDVVGPILALLDVRLEIILREYGRERACYMACDIPGAMTEIASAGGKNIKLISFCSCAEIHECISSEVLSKNMELNWPSEEIALTRFILMATDVQ
jgi:hypothetical protein